MADDPKRPLLPPVEEATVRVPLMDQERDHQESTPPPLPPSPASAEADRWFDEAPTRPSALSDLATLPPRSGTLSSDRVALAQRGEAPVDARAGAAGPSWGLVGLVAATFLTVGIVVGALIIRGC